MKDKVQRSSPFALVAASNTHEPDNRNESVTAKVSDDLNNKLD